jgi:RNA polymerase sigma-70 factor (ECF subfamily)
MRVRARRGGETAFADALQLVQPAGADPLDRITLRAALADLPEALRIIFLLKEVSGYAHDEIAELLNISVAASRVRLHRAWRALEARVRDT